MVLLSFPDGREKKYEKGITGQEIADDISTSRLRMRIHYPSDYEYGKKLGKIIGSKTDF